MATSIRVFDEVSQKERPPGGGLSEIRLTHYAFKNAVYRRWSWSNGYFFFFFAVFFAFFAFFAFLAMFPSVIPKLSASRQSTGINPSYTKIAKLILHASKKVNAVASWQSQHAKESAPSQ